MNDSDYFNNKIYLIGFMGCGKSSVAKVLRTKFGLEYIDTDKEIMRKLNMTVSDIFDKYGEDYFRNIESQILETISTSEIYQVISCGGGTILNTENVQIMKNTGKIIWLDCKTEIIYERVMRNSNRPIIKNIKSLEELEALIKNRIPYYKDICDYRIEEGKKSLYKTCEEIIRKVYV